MPTLITMFPEPFQGPEALKCLCHNLTAVACSPVFVVITNLYLFFFFLRFYVFIFRERGREGEREAEKHQCVVAFHAPPTGDLARNPGMCPDWDSNQQPFSSQSSTQSAKPYQPGPLLFLTSLICVISFD